MKASENQEFILNLLQHGCHILCIMKLLLIDARGDRLKQILITAGGCPEEPKKKLYRFF